MCYTVLYNTLSNANHFLVMLKVETKLRATKKDDYKSLHLDNFVQRYLFNDDKDTKMLDIKYIILIDDPFISKHISFTQLKSNIQST